MKFLMKVKVPVEVGNKGLKDGTMMTQMQKYLKDTKPEAVYFGVANGQRTLFLIVNVASGDMLPSLAEPLWMDFKADIHFMPVMDAKEFEKAGPSIMKVAKERK